MATEDKLPASVSTVEAGNRSNRRMQPSQARLLKFGLLLVAIGGLWLAMPKLSRVLDGAVKDFDRSIAHTAGPAEPTPAGKQLAARAIEVGNSYYFSGLFEKACAEYAMADSYLNRLLPLDVAWRYGFCCLMEAKYSAAEGAFDGLLARYGYRLRFDVSGDASSRWVFCSYLAKQLQGKTHLANELLSRAENGLNPQGEYYMTIMYLKGKISLEELGRANRDISSTSASAAQLTMVGAKLYFDGNLMEAEKRLRRVTEKRDWVVVRTEHISSEEFLAKMLLDKMK